MACGLSSQAPSGVTDLELDYGKPTSVTVGVKMSPQFAVFFPFFFPLICCFSSSYVYLIEMNDCFKSPDALSPMASSKTAEPTLRGLVSLFVGSETFQQTISESTKRMNN